MYRIDDPSASATLPTPEAALTEGYWTEGNPGTGVPATLERASWFNMIQEELRAIVVAGGITPSKTTYTQVRDAIKRINQNTVVLADTGAANAYAAVNGTPLLAGTWIDGVVQTVKIAHANTGASTYAPDGLTAIPIYGLGLQPLQGGELALNGTAILMHATIAGVNSGNPICVLMECAGGAQQVPAATQSQHALQLGQATGRLLKTSIYTVSGGVQLVSTIIGSTVTAPTSTGATTHVPLANTVACKVRVLAGGGGGGGSNGTSSTQVSMGVAGGGGSCAEGWYAPATRAIGVGLGGAGGVAGNNPGGTGGTSAYGALITALGGGAGAGGGTGTTPPFVTPGAAGGTATGGNVHNLSGGQAAQGIAMAAANVVGGNGGADIYGTGGPGQAVNFAGVSGGAPGVGGSGGVSGGSGSSNLAGGAGQPGEVTVEEWA